MPYVLDANFFIQANKDNFPLDVVPSFWKVIENLAGNGDVFSIDKVKAEIFPHEPDIKAWCDSSLPIDFFRDSSVAINEYGQVIRWATSKSHHYTPTAISEFSATNEADAWVLAYAMHHGASIVTLERSEPTRKNKIKIPDVCIAHTLDYCSTIGLLRRYSIQI